MFIFMGEGPFKARVGRSLAHAAHESSRRATVIALEFLLNVVRSSGRGLRARAHFKPMCELT